MVIWINGSFVAPDDARLSPLDAGLQHGVGLFETLQARSGGVFRLQDHLERLRRSSMELELMSSLRVEPLAKAIGEVVRKWGDRDARIRVTLTGGVVNMLKAAKDAAPVQIEPSLLIVASAATPFPQELFDRGVGVMVSDQRVSSTDRFAPHKTLAYWPRLFALRQAAQSGASESIWFDTRGRLASGCTSNIFLVESGSLLTPLAGGEVESSPVLPGICRKTTIECAQSMGIPVQRKALVIDDVLKAEECFLTNTAWGILPVVRVEKAVIAGGKPGVLTRQFQRNWRERVAKESSVVPV